MERVRRDEIVLRSAERYRGDRRCTWHSGEGEEVGKTLGKKDFRCFFFFLGVFGRWQFDRVCHPADLEAVSTIRQRFVRPTYVEFAKLYSALNKSQQTGSRCHLTVGSLRGFASDAPGPVRRALDRGSPAGQYVFFFGFFHRYRSLHKAGILVFLFPSSNSTRFR